MKTAKTTASRTWVLQAYLAVDPNRPKWAGIILTGVNGWETYHRWENGKLYRDPRLSGRSSDGWYFASKEAALEVLAELLAIPQEYYLRIVETQMVVTEVALGGFDIENGTVVRKPDGTYPNFMSKPIEGCVDAMPQMMEKTVA